MLRGDLGYGDGYGEQAAAVLQGVLRAAAWARCAATRRRRSGRRTSTATRLGGRRKIVGNAELVLSDPARATRRCASACSSTPGRSTSTAIRSRSFESVPLLGGRRAWRGTRRSARSSSATRIPLNDKPGDRIQRFQFQVGHGVLDRPAAIRSERSAEAHAPESHSAVVARRGVAARCGAGAARRPPTTRSASSTPSACSARRRRPSARSRSSRRNSPRATPRSRSSAKQVRDLQAALEKDGVDDGRGRAPQQGARPRQP